MFGMVNIDGQNYVERFVALPHDEVITAANVVLTGRRLVLPGVAPFVLKGIARESIAAGVIVARRFRFKFGNTDGGTWYSMSGIGGLNDRVVDTMIFGSGQFPFPIVPNIMYGSQASITYEIEDMAAAAVPYTIHMTFYGAFLIPVAG